MELQFSCSPALWKTLGSSCSVHQASGDSKSYWGNPLTFEEMSIFLTQVEAYVNSRPLQALSDDPDDVMAFTPGHLYPSLTDKRNITLSRWQLVQQMRDHY